MICGDYGCRTSRRSPFAKPRSLSLLEADLEDLEESVRVVQETGERWGTEAGEVGRRRAFVGRLRGEVRVSPAVSEVVTQLISESSQALRELVFASVFAGVGQKEKSRRGKKERSPVIGKGEAEGRYRDVPVNLKRGEANGRKIQTDCGGRSHLQVVYQDPTPAPLQD